VEYLVLGPLEVRDGAQAIGVESAEQRLLLAALLVHANAVVGVDRLAGILWREQPPPDVSAALQTSFAGLRAALASSPPTGGGAATLLSSARGYLLLVDPEQLDSSRFERLVVEAQRRAGSGEPSAASALLDQAIALWRGAAFAEFADADFARAEAVRLEELRRVAIEERVEANLSLGRHAELVGELEEITATYPLAERLRGQLMLALYRSGRRADAVRAYEDYRTRVHDELGIDPSAALVRLASDILDQSPQLAVIAGPETRSAVQQPGSADLARPRSESAGRTPSVGVPWRPTESGGVAPLVGRSEELDSLRQWMTEALSGAPRVVVLSGEAGVGKSRLVTELIAEARAAGIRPFAGRCLEDSQIPLLALAPVLDALGIDVRALAEAATLSSPDEHGARLAAVVDAGRALMAAAVDRPALLVLEDMQWSDPATVAFAAHVAATLQHEAVFRQLPVMLLVTARPDLGSRRSQRLLVHLAQESVSRSMHLDGLDELGVFALLEANTGVRPSEPLLHLVSAATAGNPLEIEQLVGRLARAGALERRDGELASTVREIAGLPVDVDADLGERLDELSAPTRRLVTTLALLRDRRIETLRIGAGLEPDVFEASLDEATDARLLIDDGARVDFADARVQRAVVRALTSRRRQRLHAEIAQHLVGASSADPIAITELAEQMDRAGGEGDPVVLARAARVAADEALALGMWNDATRYFEVALRSPSLEDLERAELDRRAAIAAYHCSDTRSAAAHADRAVALGRSAGDFRMWGEAALIRSRVELDATRLDPAPLREFLAAAGEREPAVRAQIHVRLSELAMNKMQLDESSVHAGTAQDIAAGIDDPSILARVEFGAGLESYGALDFERATEHFARCEEYARRDNDPLIEGFGLGRQPLVHWSRGELERAEVAGVRAARHNREHGWWAEYSLVAAVRSGIAVARGRLGAAQRLAADAESAARRAEPVGEMGLLWSAVVNTRTLLGDTIGAHRTLDDWQREDPHAATRFREFVEAFANQTPSTSGGAHPARAPMTRSGAPVDLISLALAGADVELADALEQPGIAANAPELLVAGYERGVRFSAGWCLFVPRLIGVAYLLAGDHRGAEQWLHRALADAEHSGAAGERARARYDLARTLITAGRSAEATDLLDLAITEFEQLGYRPLLVAARRLAGKPDVAPLGDAPADRVIFITDLVDSTPLNQRLGDRRFVELLREHNRVVRTRLRQHDGVEFKHTGDGIGATFFTAGAAVQCALGIRDDIERFNESRDEPLQLRIGISAGSVISNEGDLFGLAVIEAFRVCDHATDGRILVSPDIPPLVRSAETFGFRPIGEIALKGFSNTRMLYEVVRS
jgi:class 3 adenylate cyclase/DNA-binding SARP family transcriptional activator